jgi:hypothetical protein
MAMNNEIETKVKTILSFIDGAKQMGDKRLIDKILGVCYSTRQTTFTTLAERARAICEKHKSGASYWQLAVEYGLSENSIKGICDGTTTYRQPDRYVSRR